MSFGKKLREIFGDRQGAAINRARRKILSGANWDAVKDDVFPPKGNSVPIAPIVDAIIEVKSWQLLTPIVREVGDWVGVIELVHRKGEFGAIRPSRVQELEDIYNALHAAGKPHGPKVAEAFVNAVEIWACQHNFEDGYDWAKKKPEFVPVPPLGLAFLCEKPIEGNPLAMKVFSTHAEITRAMQAVDWVNGNSFDRDEALDNLIQWQAKLTAQKKSGPKPPQP